MIKSIGAPLLCLTHLPPYSKPVLLYAPYNMQKNFILIKTHSQEAFKEPICMIITEYSLSRYEFWYQITDCTILQLMIMRDSGRETRTLSMLGGDEGLDECVGGLCIKWESVAEWRELGAFFQEGFLQAVSSSMEILLRRGKDTWSLMMDCMRFCWL